MAQAAWAWRRWISPDRQEEWIERLQKTGCSTWTLTERPDRKRILLAVYHDTREPVLALHVQFGGLVRSIKQSEWLSTKPVPPTRIGQRLEIVHDSGGSASRPDPLKIQLLRSSPRLRLFIPHGLAFGSGEHATTFMLLRALTAPRDWRQTTVLDLGTGSGVLALVARLLGAKKITATDFDSEAVRTARQNEALNFSRPQIRWSCADVRRLNAKARYDLVLANLFSGILCEAAVQIADSVSPGGELWLSGVLRSQRDEVVAAYRTQGLKLARINHRGKWIMLQWTAPLKTKLAAKRMPPR